jgi:hypothetical protein
VIELMVPPTLDESLTSMVMSAAKANEPEESPAHCPLQRVAVIGLGRTATAKAFPDDDDEVRLDGAVALLLQAADVATTTTLRPRKRAFTMSPRRPSPLTSLNAGERAGEESAWSMPVRFR